MSAKCEFKHRNGVLCKKNIKFPGSKYCFFHTWLRGRRLGLLITLVVSLLGFLAKLYIGIPGDQKKLHMVGEDQTVVFAERGAHVTISQQNLKPDSFGVTSYEEKAQIENKVGASAAKDKKSTLEPKNLQETTSITHGESQPHLPQSSPIILAENELPTNKSTTTSTDSEYRAQPEEEVNYYLIENRLGQKCKGKNLYYVQYTEKPSRIYSFDVHLVPTQHKEIILKDTAFEGAIISRPFREIKEIYTTGDGNRCTLKITLKNGKTLTGYASYSTTEKHEWPFTDIENDSQVSVDLKEIRRIMFPDKYDYLYY